MVKVKGREGRYIYVCACVCVCVHKGRIDRNKRQYSAL